MLEDLLEYYKRLAVQAAKEVTVICMILIIGLVIVGIILYFIERVR